MEGSKRRIIDHNHLSDHEKKNLLILETIRRKGSSQIGRDTGALYRLWKASKVRLTK